MIGSNCIGNALRGMTIATVVFVLSGCSNGGPKLEPLSGQVMRDGKPMTNVSIAMVPVGSGLAAMGSADASGNILVQTNGQNGAMKGKYNVGITEPMRKMTPESIASGSPPPVSFNPKFESPDKSGIEYEVVDGGGKFEFTVTNK